MKRLDSMETKTNGDEKETGKPFHLKIIRNCPNTSIPIYLCIFVPQRYKGILIFYINFKVTTLI